MTSLLEKRDLILENERRFADLLGREVLATPKMNIWMVLIPFILIYHIYQARRVADGRKVFIRNYLRSRERALEEGLRFVEKGTAPVIETMSDGSDLPEPARKFFREFIMFLAGHYRDLLRSDGTDMESLIRSTYKNRMNYLLFLQRLNQAEKALNDALRPHITGAGVEEVLETMETVSQRLRREYAAAVFA
ncbi:MAG: NF038143 family protein [Desulfobacterales bacterium]|nr:NF038143 family protein [Desulfobacterales bacterium]